MITRLKTLALAVGCFATTLACDDEDSDNKRALASTDRTFVQGAAVSNIAEIDFGALAATRGNSEMVREYGQHMVAEHTTAHNELRALADDYNNADLPGELDAQHKQVRERLLNLTGYSFDSLYISSQIVDHEMTLDIFQTELSGGVEQPIKTYAQKYQPHIQMHLEKADSIMNVLLADPQSD